MSLVSFPRLLWLALLWPVCAAHSAIQLERTRLVVHAADGRATMQIHSKDQYPLLLQVWVDAGDDDPQGHAGTPPITPFIVDPPVLRLQPGQSRAVQIWVVNAPATLPAARESLYWLNVLEVPAVASGAASNRLHMSVQSRIKLFYRPQALAHYAVPFMLQDADRLRFTLERAADGHMWLHLHNPAPIHQSLATLAVYLDGDGAEPVVLNAPMLAPFAHARLALPRRMHAARGASVPLRFATIDDDGNVLETTQVLSGAIPAQG